MNFLGFIGGSVGGTIAGPAGAAAGAQVGGNLPGILTNLFGGAGRDAQRQARVDLMTSLAIDSGSVLAMRVILGGPANVGSNEDPMWIKAADKVRQARPDVYNAAINAGGPYWDSTDNDSMDKTRAKINAELAQSDMNAIGTRDVTTLPLMQTTASTLTGAPGAGVSPIVIGVTALVLVALLVVFSKRGAP
jgi:hypothetical protein